MDKKLIVIGGPTAVGKTAIAIQLAKKYRTEIISADSRQVYKEMNIGTAKPSAEELSEVQHHFINSHSIHQPISAGQYEREARKLIEKLFATYNILIAVGGSGLYIKAITEGLDDMPEIDPEVRENLNRELQKSGLENLVEELRSIDPEYSLKADLSNPRRVIRALEIYRSSGTPYSQWRKRKKTSSPPWENIMIGLELERSELYERIENRMDSMLEAGLVDEARSFLPLRHLSSLQTVGYTEIFDHIEGKYDMEECIRLLKRNSRRYAKRQMTWFQNQEEMKWFSPFQYNEIADYLDAVHRL